MQIFPVRGVVVSVIVVGLLLVFAALNGLLLVLALVVFLAVLNVVYLPRAAADCGSRWARWRSCPPRCCTWLVAAAYRGWLRIET